MCILPCIKCISVHEYVDTSVFEVYLTPSICNYLSNVECKEHLLEVITVDAKHILSSLSVMY